MTWLIDCNEMDGRMNEDHKCLKWVLIDMDITRGVNKH